MAKSTLETAETTQEATRLRTSPAVPAPEARPAPYYPPVPPIDRPLTSVSDLPQHGSVGLGVSQKEQVSEAISLLFAHLPGLEPPLRDAIHVVLTNVAPGAVLGATRQDEINLAVESLVPLRNAPKAVVQVLSTV